MNTTDYKKWLLYSFDKQPIENYHHLFTTLKNISGSGPISIEQSVGEGAKVFSIACEGIASKLELTESQKVLLQQYLVDNYFHTESVEHVIQENKRDAEKQKNHQYIQTNESAYREETVEVKPHPKESRYYNIMLIISLLVYGAFLFYIVLGAIRDVSSLFFLLLFIPLVLLFMLFARLTKGFWVGLIRGNSVRVTKDQFPEIYNIVEAQARALKLKDLPEIYITDGHFNAFVMKFSRTHVLMLFSEVVETTLHGKYDVLKYVTAHELCHIKQRHLAKERLLFPARLIPFLGLAYSRGREYTCDRTGYHFSPKGAVEGILVMTTGKEIHSRLNVETHIKNCEEQEGFWTWFSEKFITHPHHYKRLVQIREYSRYN